MCAKSACWAVLFVAVSGAAMAGGQRELLEYGDELLGEIIASMIPPERRGDVYEGGWKHAFSNVVKGEYAIDEFVPHDERIEAWTRLFTQQNLRRQRSSPESPKSMMSGLRKTMQTRCPDVAWNVVRESNSDIVYEFHFTACEGQPGQHEIARIVYGNWNIWRLAYTQKGPPLDETARAQWVEALSRPQIVRQ